MTVANVKAMAIWGRDMRCPVHDVMDREKKSVPTVMLRETVRYMMEPAIFHPVWEVIHMPVPSVEAEAQPLPAKAVAAQAIARLVAEPAMYLKEEETNLAATDSGDILVFFLRDGQEYHVEFENGNLLQHKTRYQVDGFKELAKLLGQLSEQNE